MKLSTLTVLVTALDASPLFRAAYWALQRAHAAHRRSDALRRGEDPRPEELWMEICELRRADARAELGPCTPL